jgi:hypothetical protein
MTPKSSSDPKVPPPPSLPADPGCLGSGCGLGLGGAGSPVERDGRRHHRSIIASLLINPPEEEMGRIGPNTIDTGRKIPWPEPMRNGQAVECTIHPRKSLATSSAGLREVDVVKIHHQHIWKCHPVPPMPPNKSTRRTKMKPQFAHGRLSNSHSTTAAWLLSWGEVTPIGGPLPASSRTH